MLKKIRLTLILSGGFFLFLDQWLKYQSAHAWSSPHLLNKFFGWQPSVNPGIGFGLPVPNFLIILLTLIILAVVVYLFLKSQNKISDWALALIFTGAVSNLIDRLIFGHVLDYFLLFTSLINLGDFFIVSGFVIYLVRTSSKS